MRQPLTSAELCPLCSRMYQLSQYKQLPAERGQQCWLPGLHENLYKQAIKISICHLPICKPQQVVVHKSTLNNKTSAKITNVDDKAISLQIATRNFSCIGAQQYKHAGHSQPHCLCTSFVANVQRSHLPCHLRIVGIFPF